MPSGGPRRWRRDNGLVAEEYTLVADVEPHVGEYLLDMLGASGIAAYLQPATTTDPLSRAPSQDPTVCLYADSTQLDIARDYLAQLDANNPSESPEMPNNTPGPPAEATGGAPDEANATATDADDIDAVFARIVARFHETSAIGQVPWPAAEDLGRPIADGDHDSGSGGNTNGALDTDGDLDSDPGKAAGPFRRRRTDRLPDLANGDDEPEEPSLLEALDLFGADLPDSSDDESYVPPPPPPLPRPSAAAVAGLVSIIGGIVLFFWPSILPTDADTAMVLGFAAILAGFVTLVLRLRSSGEGDDPDDDGARV